jgi:hypothetical protein
MRPPGRLEELGPPNLKVVGFGLWVHGREFATAEEPWDEDWLRVTGYCAAPGARVWVSGPVLGSTSLARWAAECEALHATLSGRAELRSLEPNLRAVIEPEGRSGQLVFAVFITPDHMTQEHRFEFGIDQSYLPQLLKDLRVILAAYPVPAGLSARDA